jgi:hypothetical protein
MKAYFLSVLLLMFALVMKVQVSNQYRWQPACSRRHARCEQRGGNHTDVRYRANSSGITAPGRNFILALRASF